MGYTHYWEAEKGFNKEALRAAIKDMGDIVKDNKDILAGWDGSGDPEVSEEVVRFNGIGSHSHETFSVEESWDGDFNFCKTARKPYDKVVVACLVVLKHHLDGGVRISSDGEGAEDLAEGLRLAAPYIAGGSLMDIERLYETYIC